MTYEHEYGSTERCSWDIVNLSGVFLAVIVKPHGDLDTERADTENLGTEKAVLTEAAVTALLQLLTQDQQKALIDRMKSLVAGGCNADPENENMMEGAENEY